MIGTKKAPEGAFGMLHLACWLGAQRPMQRCAVVTPPADRRWATETQQKTPHHGLCERCLINAGPRCLDHRLVLGTLCRHEVVELLGGGGHGLSHQRSKPLLGFRVLEGIDKSFV